MVDWYYRCEVKGIQAFVMRGTKLREIVGGSALIESMFGADDEPEDQESLIQRAKHSILTEHSADVRVVYCAAGGATLTFSGDPEGKALDAWITQWPIWVAENLPGLHLAQAWVSADVVERDFRGSAVQALAARLDVARHQATVDLPRATPVLEQGVRGGIACDELNFDRNKSDVGRQNKQFADLTSLRQLNASEGKLNKQLKERFFSDFSLKYDNDIRLPTDNNDISGDHYLAVIHIDGNRVGRLLPKFSQSLESFATFSEALSAATRAAVQEAGNRALIESGQKHTLGRPIVVGGDDVTAIVRADKALEFTSVFIKTFEDETHRRLSAMPELKSVLGEAGCLTASAGIALIRRNHPFSDGYHLAEKLCKQAKRSWANSVPAEHDKLGADSSLGPSMIAFQRVTSSLADLDWPSKDGLKHRIGPYYLSGLAYAETAADRQFPNLNTLVSLVNAVQNRQVAKSRLRTLIDLVSQARAETKESLETYSSARLDAEWARINQVHEERETTYDRFWTGDLLNELRNLVDQASDVTDWRETTWAPVWRDQGSTTEGNAAKWSGYGSPWVDVYDLVGSGAVTRETLQKTSHNGGA